MILVYYGTVLTNVALLQSSIHSALDHIVRSNSLINDYVDNATNFDDIEDFIEDEEILFDEASPSENRSATVASTQSSSSATDTPSSTSISSPPSSTSTPSRLPTLTWIH